MNRIAIINTPFMIAHSLATTIVVIPPFLTPRHRIIIIHFSTVDSQIMTFRQKSAYLLALSSLFLIVIQCMIKTTTDFFIMYNGKLTMCAIVAYYMVLSAICCIHKKQMMMMMLPTNDDFFEKKNYLRFASRQGNIKLDQSVYLTIEWLDSQMIVTLSNYIVRLIVKKENFIEDIVS